MGLECSPWLHSRPSFFHEALCTCTERLCVASVHSHPGQASVSPPNLLNSSYGSQNTRSKSETWMCVCFWIPWPTRRRLCAQPRPAHLPREMTCLGKVLCDVPSLPPISLLVKRPGMHLELSEFSGDRVVTGTLSSFFLVYLHLSAFPSCST